MSRLTRFPLGLLLAWMLASCGTPTMVPSTPALPQPTGEIAGMEDTQAPSAYPLAEPGPYYVGKLTLDFVDASRHNRPVGIEVWYPAVLPEGSSGSRLPGGEKRDPDRSGAPYPLIVSSAMTSGTFAPYLVTHGFVWAGVTGIGTYFVMNPEMIDQPLDILFTLDQIAANPPAGLAGMIDADHAGAIGYSFDGYNTLALSGARLDPEYYWAQCPDPDATTKAILFGGSAFNCYPAGAWDEFAGHAPEAITASQDGLWQPMTDERIRAVMPMAGEGWWLFGERGLAAVNRPTLMIVATWDGAYPENALILEHLGTPDKALISFVGEDHLMIGNAEMRARMAHFAVAFFGYHLQGREDLAYYFSEEFVNQHDELAWGVYEGE